MANIWGMDEAGMKAAGAAANDLVWVLAQPPWGIERSGHEGVQ